MLKQLGFDSSIRHMEYSESRNEGSDVSKFDSRAEKDEVGMTDKECSTY